MEYQSTANNVDVNNNKRLPWIVIMQDKVVDWLQ